MKSIQFLIKCLLFNILFFHTLSFSQDYKILESDDKHILIEFDFSNKFSLQSYNVNNTKYTEIIDKQFPVRNPGEPFLPTRFYEIGIPLNSDAFIYSLEVIDKQTYSDQFVRSTPDSGFQPFDKLNYNQEIYGVNSFFPQTVAEISSQAFFRYVKTASLSVSPYQFNPVERTIVFNKKILIYIEYKLIQNFNGFITFQKDPMTEDMIDVNTINPVQSKNFMGKIEPLNKNEEEKYWYDPNKEYYKIYLNQKGVYRITYEQLDALGIPINNVDIVKFQIFNDGKEIPLYIKDTDENQIFTPGDYIEYVGYAPTSTPFSYFNIYNNQNVYWLSYQADSTGKRYTYKDGYPINWFNSFAATPFTLHFEKDTLYEPLGHAMTDQRDYWFWGKTSGTNGTLKSLFSAPFLSPNNLLPGATEITVRVNMHGMTTNQCVYPDHRVKISLTSQLIGEHLWDGANSSTFETVVNLNQIHIFPQNNLQVAAYGDIAACDSTNPNEIRNDEIRVNWFEIDYPMELRAFENNLYFLSPPNTLNLTRFQIFNWQRDNIKIYSPSKSEMIVNADITNDQYKSVFFIDNLTSERKEYFCAAEDYFLTPDSIIKMQSTSDLRNTSNGADYLIITHKEFLIAANELAEFRQNNFSDTSITNPRIMIVDVDDIYDEFSYGLMSPFAIKDFISYAFNYWVAPSVGYVVLLGDMSHDYRKLLTDSRPNFIPSIPYHITPYGQSPSDNNFVAIIGNDKIPDLAIGRLSCETEAEAEILLNKIKNYPADDGKLWKQNVLLMSSGQDQSDENFFGFNRSNFDLERFFLKPNGISTTKVFRFPGDSIEAKFQGDGPEIKKGFNTGAVIASYYGHGGGYQWDLVFNDDDILLLQNENRLSFITSVTCYTAHFDNQDVFGEKFTKVPNKGSIAFWGSSGLTFWAQGKQLNERLFYELFQQKNYVIGKAILNAKSSVNDNPQVALLTLLGDPLLKLALPDKPDFVIMPTDISISPQYPQKNDTISVLVHVSNLGIVFPYDSVSMELFVSSQDTSYSLDTHWIKSFGESDSVIFRWTPSIGANYTLEARINNINPIPEMDYTDNSASAHFIVYDLSEPSIIKPIDGYVSRKDSVLFLFADPGIYSKIDLDYFIEIDSSTSFNNPLVRTGALKPHDGKLIWVNSNLQPGYYFWRARMLSPADSSNWSQTRILTISDSSKTGYFVNRELLKILNKRNIIYSDSLEGLINNISYLPPRPSNSKFLDSISVSLPDSLLNLSALTNDGTYLYVAHMSYYGGDSKIYKFGTGFNGTTFGQNYGEIPNLNIPVWHSIFYLNNQGEGKLYVAIGEAYSLLQVNPLTGDTLRINIPDGLLNSVDSRVRNGAYYLNTDGRYVYNVAYIDESGQSKYRIRKFDPLNNWVKVGEDLIPDGSSFANFTGFFIADNYCYPYENYQEGYMRRINLTTGEYEEEWRSFEPFQGFYAWSYDWINDIVYTSVFQPGYNPKFFKFFGKYLEATGVVVTAPIGPASKWNKLNCDITDESIGGTYSILLSGLNSVSKNWDTLTITPHTPLDLSNINPDLYSFLKVQISILDTSFGATNYITIKNLELEYQPIPELMISPTNITFLPDSNLQGFPITINTFISNVGYTDANNVRIDYHISDTEIHLDTTVIYSKITNLTASDGVQFSDTLFTNSLLFKNFLTVKVTYDGKEYYSFNNVATNSFYVARDSTNPMFNITFDGKEIINGDIISSEPEVVITLEDNSPLQLDSTFFTIVHTYKNVPKIIRIPGPDIKYENFPYPNSKVIVTWTPKLEDGRHVLEVLAKDASGNFFDSTSSRSVFNVFNNPDLLQVYNYPNPFSDNTYFTFELRGVLPPEEFKIKIFTVAGRLIREIIPSTPLQIGFNKIFWDGKDQDGDEVANGLYFYKIISKHNGEVKTTLQKLAKVK